MDTQAFLDSCHITPDVFELRPDYRALLITVTGLDSTTYASNTAHVDALIEQAQQHAEQLLEGSPVEELPHIASWREAYRAFGAKPQRTRNSLEALTRRAPGGLPRVGTLTDIYNALSVLYQIPLGGEDLDKYAGPAILTRSDGTEPFPTTSHGEPVTENPTPGEVIWTTGGEVTCRRWNWRQGTTTALTENTTNAFFICDALDPVTTDELRAFATALAEAFAPLGAAVTTHHRIIENS